MSNRAAVIVWMVGIRDNLPFQRGRCSWCGEAIELTELADHRMRARTRHRGDQFEVGERNCHALNNRSRVWSARDLVLVRGDPECVDCGDTSSWWEADHDLALIDGGAHSPVNIVRRCTPCHREKTAREAGERAARRRTVADQMELAA